MRVCYLDAFSGISGDMTVGALLDAGADFAALEQALQSLGTGASFRLEKTKRRGIAASKFHVDGGEAKSHRHLSHIVNMIEGSGLPPEVKQTSLAVFRRLGEAEARVHDMPLEKVHFHEVGAVDSICDIVGACFCLHNLRVDAVYSGPLNLGSGTVKADHGVMPVPTPATALLVEGKPVYARGPALELTTPTGAALVSTLAREWGTLPPMTITASGYGAGDRDFPEHANVLRALIGEVQQAAESITVAVMETNIDDASPQVLAYAMERLLEEGALDVTMTPMVMKKGRLATQLSVVTTPADRDRLAELVLRETTALGVRLYSAERRVRPREFSEVQAAGGSVHIKSTAGGAHSPEYEDCRRIARETGRPLKDVMAEAWLAFVNQNR